MVVWLNVHNSDEMKSSERIRHLLIKFKNTLIKNKFTNEYSCYWSERSCRKRLNKSTFTKYFVIATYRSKKPYFKKIKILNY